MQAAEKVLKNATKRMPATIRKVDRGPRKHFNVYTVTQLMESFRDPRAVLLEIASTETQDLADKLGCSLMEALGERRLAAQTVLPYVSQKLPVQVDMRHTKAIHLNIVTSDEYKQIEALAQPDAPIAHLIEGIGIEAAQEGET